MAWATSMVSFLIRPDSVEDPDLDRIDMVIRCLDKWLAVQRLLAPRSRMGTLMWAEVKGSVDARRIALKQSPH